MGCPREPAGEQGRKAEHRPALIPGRLWSRGASELVVPLGRGWDPMLPRRDDNPQPLRLLGPPKSRGLMETKKEEGQ